MVWLVWPALSNCSRPVGTGVCLRLKICPVGESAPMLTRAFIGPWLSDFSLGLSRGPSLFGLCRAGLSGFLSRGLVTQRKRLSALGIFFAEAPGFWETLTHPVATLSDKALILKLRASKWRWAVPSICSKGGKCPPSFIFAVLAFFC